MDPRARIFLLSADNEWTDVATGTCRTAATQTEFTLQIYDDTSDEPDPPLLFTAAILSDTEVAVQQDTVIAWTRPDDGGDIAVSFETQPGCEAVWRDVCRFQGKPLSPIREAPGEVPQLPQIVDRNTLPVIAEALEQAVNLPFVKRQLAQCLFDNGFVRQLLTVFREAEQAKDVETLRLLYTSFKSIVLLNSPLLLKEMFGEEHVIDVAGVFEYEPMGRTASVVVGCAQEQSDNHSQTHDIKPQYRQYLSQTSNFHQIVPVRSEHLLALIHQTFRAQYFKDVILPRVLDDDAFTTLVMLIRTGHMEIISGLEGEGAMDPFLTTQSLEQALQILRFFKEFLTIARTSISPSQLRLYQYLHPYIPHQSRTEALGKFVGFLERILCNDLAGPTELRSSCRVLAVDLLLAICQHDPHILRQLIVDTARQEKPLFDSIIQAFLQTTHDTDAGIRWQLAFLLRTLLDNTAPQGFASPPVVHSRTMDDLLNVFYPQHATALLSPLTTTPIVDADDLLFHVCDLLAFFISAHKYRIKYLLLRSAVVHRTLTDHLLLSPASPPYLRAAALRVFRTMIGVNDDFYYRFLIKHGTIKSVLGLLRQVSGTRSLLESAVLDLFEAIRSGQSRLLVNCVIEHHGRELRGVDNRLYERMKETYDRLNPPISGSTGNDREEDEEEEEYFEGSSTTADDEAEERPEQCEGENEPTEDNGRDHDNAPDTVHDATPDNGPTTVHDDAAPIPIDHRPCETVIQEERPYSPSKRFKTETCTEGENESHGVLAVSDDIVPHASDHAIGRVEANGQSSEPHA